MDFWLAISALFICALVVTQTGWWCVVSIQNSIHTRKRVRRQQLEWRNRIDSSLIESETGTGSWLGFRKFLVDRLEPEAEGMTSVYLRPEDGKPIPGFRPGQHLTFRFTIPGVAKPVVRCYSLSDAANKNYYRITVKVCRAPQNRPELPPGKASSYINSGLSVGDRLDVKAPAGEFYLDESSQRPIVLLAGGVGITPMISILNTLVQKKSSRLALLVYGVRQSSDHAFRDHFAAMDREQSNVQVVTCYSNPAETDQLGNDFNFLGRPSVELLRKLLPNPNFDFYLCGPPPFMSGIYSQLIEWGVPDENIRFEAFGPASIKRISQEKETPQAEVTEAESFQVEFVQSGRTFHWNGECGNLLEFAEQNDLNLDSGCRAGSCGTCEIDLIDGEVNQQDRIQGSRCLACVSRPNSNLKIDA